VIGDRLVQPQQTPQLQSAHSDRRITAWLLRPQRFLRSMQNREPTDTASYYLGLRNQEKFDRLCKQVLLVPAGE